MPKKKKTTAAPKVQKAQKVQVKQLKKVTKKTSKAKVDTKKVVPKVKAKAVKAKTVTRAPKQIRALEISKHDEIVHAAETYAVSIDEIIRAGNQEYKMMQVSGRGQEITAPSISMKSVDGAQAKQEVKKVEPEKTEEIIEATQEIFFERIQNEEVSEVSNEAPQETERVEDKLSEEDRKALALVRARLESQTVMIRSVSPLQTPFAHSSRNFVKETPQKTSKAPLVFLSSAAVVFAAFVVAVVVSKTGNFGPAQFVAPQAQKVAGAETGPQQFEANDYSFSYPGNWYVTQTQEKALTLRDSQKVSAETVNLAKSSLDGKTFQDWLKNQKDASQNVQSLGNTNPQVFQASSSLFYVVGKSDVIAVSTKSTKESTLATALNVAKSLVFS